MQPLLVIVPEDQKPGAEAVAHPANGPVTVISPVPTTGDPLPPLVALDLARKHPKAARILISGLRCAAALTHLREQGYAAERAGNQLFGGDADPADAAALPGDTLPEQLAATANKPLPTDQARQQAWQRDGWAGLSALGLPWQDALDLANASTADAPADAPLRLDDLILTLARCANEQALRALADRAQQPKPPRQADPPRYQPATPGQEPDASDYEQARHASAPVRLRPVLALGLPTGTGDLSPTQTDRLVLLTGRDHLDWLVSLLGEPALQRDFDLSLALGRARCLLLARRRASAAPMALERLVSRLLAVTLVTGRPLRHYDCTFLLPLDPYADTELPTAADQQPARQPALANALEAALGRQIKAGAVQRVPACDTATALSTLNVAIAQATNDPAKARAIAAGQPDDRDLPTAQALLYFLPEVQRDVLDPLQGRLAHWRLKDTAGLQLQVQDQRAASDPDRLGNVTAPVTELALLRYDPPLYLLAIRCTLPASAQLFTDPFEGHGADWWHALFDPAKAQTIQAAQAERWLWFTQAARLLRTAFPEQRLEGKLAPIVLLGKDNHEIARWDGDKACNPIIPTCLRRLLGLTNGSDIGLTNLSERLAAVRDDRMVVNVAHALAGPPPGDDAARAAFRRFFSLALFVDRGRDTLAAHRGLVYDPGFVGAALATQVEQRWEGAGTLLGCTNYAQAAAGFGPFFCGPVARLHVPEIYGRMLMLVLFFELTLAHFNRRIAAETSRLASPKATNRLAALTRCEGLHQDFICFSNRNWLREVSSQSQGRDVFERLTRAFGLDAQYALVKDRLERTDDLVQARTARQEAGHARRLTGAAVALALLGLLFAAAQLTPDAPAPPDIPTPGLRGWLGWIGTWLIANPLFTFVTLPILGVAAWRVAKLFTADH